MKTILFIALGFLPLLILAQPLPDRYRTEVFSSFEERSDSLFSAGVPQPIPGGGFWEWFTGFPLNADETNTTPVDLKMDIFEPTGDTLSKRPAIVICFGGGFLTGDKDHWSIRLLAEQLARRGFVTATIDYRLGMNIFDQDLGARAVYRAVQDGRAAIKYLRANASTFNIDPDEIYIGGHSAGAFIALHNLYLDREMERPISTLEWMQDDEMIPDLGCLDCTGISAEISGQANCGFSLAGAVGFLSYIESASDGETSLFHSEDDDTVPHDTGEPFSSISGFIGGSDLPIVYGSLPISLRSDSLGLDYTFNSYTNRGHGVHEAPGDTELYSDILPGISNWFYGQRLKPEEHPLTGRKFICPDRHIQSYSVAIGDAVHFDWQIVGGSFITQSSTSNSVIVVWSDTASIRTISVTPYNTFAARGTLQELTVTLAFQAQNTWLGGSGNWHEATNWSLGHVPLRCENVIITHAGAVITIDIAPDSVIEVHSVWAIGDVEVRVGDGAVLSIEAE